MVHSSLDGLFLRLSEECLVMRLRIEEYARSYNEAIFKEKRTAAASREIVESSRIYFSPCWDAPRATSGRSGH